MWRIAMPTRSAVSKLWIVRYDQLKRWFPVTLAPSETSFCRGALESTVRTSLPNRWAIAVRTVAFRSRCSPHGTASIATE